MRLLLDEHIDRSVASRLRARGFDVLAVTEDAHLVRASDAQLLAHATGDRRALVTYDVVDFRVLTSARVASEESHFGVILLNARRFPQGKRYIGALVSALEDLLVGEAAEDALADRVIWLG